jgi:hypothetical protein
MANINTQGFGLIAAMRVGNTPAISGQSKYEIDAGETNAIYNGEPVKIDVNATTGGYIVTAAAGTASVGVLNGVLYTDATTKNQLGVTTTQQLQLQQIVKTSLHL